MPILGGSPPSLIPAAGCLKGVPTPERWIPGSRRTGAALDGRRSQKDERVPPADTRTGGPHRGRRRTVFRRVGTLYRARTDVGPVPGIFLALREQEKSKTVTLRGKIPFLAGLADSPGRGLDRLSLRHLPAAGRSRWTSAIKSTPTRPAPNAKTAMRFATTGRSRVFPPWISAQAAMRRLWAPPRRRRISSTAMSRRIASRSGPRMPASRRTSSFSHSVHVKRARMTCESCHGDTGSSDTLRPYQADRISGYSRDIWKQARVQPAARHEDGRLRGVPSPEGSGTQLPGLP